MEIGHNSLCSILFPRLLFANKWYSGTNEKFFQGSFRGNLYHFFVPPSRSIIHEDGKVLFRLDAEYIAVDLHVPAEPLIIEVIP